MPFWKCYYHITWATKHRQSIISPAVEQIIYASTEKKSLEMGCNVLAINGVEDHIHVAVNIPPAIAVSKWVGAAKGASSHAVNAALESSEHFQWQEGYGVLSFGEKNLEQVKEYIANQKERHQSNNLNSHLERFE